MASFLEKEFYKNLFTPTNPPKQNDNGSYWYPIGSLSDFSDTKYLQQFLMVPELNSIINLRARSIANWKLELISKATGLPAKNNESIVRILNKPNFFQSQVEFWRQSELFRAIYANEYIYFLTPAGMSSTYKGMFTLDPAKVKIEYKPEGYYFHDSTGENVKYWYIDGENKIELEKKNLIHLNDNRVTPDNILKGTSKLSSLQPNIQNIISAYEKRNIMLNMPIGVMTNTSGDSFGQAMPMDEKEMLSTTNSLKRKGSHPILTNLAVKYESITNSPTSMGLFEETREDTAKICDAYGIPYELLSSQKGTTFTNLKEAKKQMYEDSIIPDANEKIGALNEMFAGKSFEVSGTFKHLAVFAEDQKQRSISFKQMVEALSKALADNAITIEEYKIEMNKFNIGI
jgi:HK97 family phage portal protein